MTDYDVIVIGSGIGGLTAAALLAKAGKSVLVVEAHDRPGGYAHGFKRKRYHFDSGVHLVSGCGEQGYTGGQIIYKTLSTLGVLEEIEFLPVDPFSHVHLPDIDVQLPQSLNKFITELSEKFPLEREGITALTQLCLQITEEIAIADEFIADVNHDQAQQLMPALFKYRKATLSEVAKQFIQSDTLLSAFSCNWPYLGLPPSKVSFVYWSTMLIGYMVDGSYYCKGGFQKLADTLVNGLKKYQGEIRFKTPVEKVMIEHSQVTGIQINGQAITAPVVISNADFRQTIYQLVGEQHFPKRYLARINKLQHSLSIFVVYLATDLDLNALQVSHESFCFLDEDHEINFAKTCEGKLNWLSITVPTLIDPELAPEGQHLLMLTTLMPFRNEQDWKASKSEYIEEMVTMAADRIPNLERHILFKEGGSPATMHRYTRNYQGAAYGWDVIPHQVGPARIQNRSPLSGLFFSGHWTAPGGGVYGVSVSGLKTAQNILGIKKQSEFWTKIC